MPNGIQTLGTEIVADLQMEQKSSSQCQKLPASSLCHHMTPSQFPSTISTDSLCSSFRMAGSSCSCICRMLEKIQLISYSFGLVISAVCWHIPASSWLGNTNPLTVHTSCRQDHCLYSPARALELALTQGLWCTRRAAPDGARNCARWCITSTAEHTPHPQQSSRLPSASVAVQSAVSAGCLWDPCSGPCTYMCSSPVPAERVLDPL